MPQRLNLDFNMQLTVTAKQDNDNRFILPFVFYTNKDKKWRDERGRRWRKLRRSERAREGKGKAKVNGEEDRAGDRWEAGRGTKGRGEGGEERRRASEEEQRKRTEREKVQAKGSSWPQGRQIAVAIETRYPRPSSAVA